MGKHKRGRMGSLGDKAFRQTDEELAEEELKRLRNTKVDWEELRPEIDDQDLYDELIFTVEEAVKKNESIARLGKRISLLGREGVKLARKVLGMI